MIPVQLPALRDRKDDIPLLRATSSRSTAKRTQAVTSSDDDALELLLEYDWPGNVRELQNVIERAAVLMVGSPISVCLPGTCAAPPLRCRRSRFRRRAFHSVK